MVVGISSTDDFRVSQGCRWLSDRNCHGLVDREDVVGKGSVERVEESRWNVQIRCLYRTGC